jgi:phosphatidylserine decarboxylase
MDKEKIEKTRVNNPLPVAREGIPFIIIAVGMTLIIFSFGLFYTGIILGLLSLFVIYFFRDPERERTFEKNEIISPADGKVINIWNLDNNDNPLGEPAKKISIFMNVFNVHVNRAPVSGKVTGIVYNPGKFVSANLDKASEENENNRITLETENNRKIVFIQIAGLIARRIVCWIKVKDYVRVGQRMGLIRFGSRLDVFIPAESDATVKAGQKVKAGITTIGYLK